MAATRVHANPNGTHKFVGTTLCPGDHAALVAYAHKNKTTIAKVLQTIISAVLAAAGEDVQRAYVLGASGKFLYSKQLREIIDVPID